MRKNGDGPCREARRLVFTLCRSVQTLPLNNAEPVIPHVVLAWHYKRG